MTDHRDDIHDIGQVMIRYATSVDRRDLERYATCFTPDVVVTGFGDVEFDEREAYVEWVAAALSRYRATHHQITNQEVELDGDRAHLRSHVQATHVSARDADELVILWGIYDDRLIRTDAGWQITHHHLERLIEPRIVRAERP